MKRALFSLFSSLLLIMLLLFLVLIVICDFYGMYCLFKEGKLFFKVLISISAPIILFVGAHDVLQKINKK